MREDTMTHWPEDAAAYEQERGGTDLNRPTRQEARADAVQDRIEDRQRERAEAAAARRGEYVPDDATRMTRAVLGITFAQHGLPDVRVVAVRDGVYRIDGLTDRTHPVWETFDPKMYDVAERGGFVWMKAKFVDDEPPY